MATQTVNERETFIQTCEREFPTTLKILRAFPDGREDFKPAEKSRTARDLAWNFVLETKIGEAALAGKIDFSQPTPKAPAVTVRKIADMVEEGQRSLIAKVRAASESDLDRMVGFPVGPKQMGNFRAVQLLWMPIMDMIHHRGQFSVYLRMVGAKVPSIYGPTADETWM